MLPGWGTDPIPRRRASLSGRTYTASVYVVRPPPFCLFNLRCAQIEKTKG
jgi:hypothetical protein